MTNILPRILGLELPPRRGTFARCLRKISHSYDGGNIIEQEEECKMLVLEFKAYGKTDQFQAIDEAIRICQFIRNKSIRLWMDGGAKSWFDLSKYCAIWAKEFDFANKL
jgi:hypothetical protein